MSAPGSVHSWGRIGNLGSLKQGGLNRRRAGLVETSMQENPTVSVQRFLARAAFRQVTKMGLKRRAPAKAYLTLRRPRTLASSDSTVEA